MATPGFNEEHYLSQKLESLRSSQNEELATEYADKTTAELRADIIEAGFASPMDHYEQVGKTEFILDADGEPVARLTPNEFFNAEEYATAKAEQLIATVEEYANSTVAEARDAFLAAVGEGNEYTHYLQFGDAEGINPSNDFDADAYYANKLAALKANSETADEYETATADDLKAEYAELGISALEHYELAGKEEGITVTAVSESEAVTPVTANFALTTAADTIDNATADDETISGVVATRSSEETLNGGDVIDGDGGSNTLELDVSSDFRGFDNADAVQNVQTLDITNSSSQSRSFNATGVNADLESVSITANDEDFTVSNLSAIPSLEVSDADEDNTIEVSYDSSAEVTKGEEDAMSVTLNDVGTAKTDSTAAEAVEIRSAGIEDVTVTSAGDENIVDLALGGTESVTVDGAADTQVTAVDAGLTDFIATAATGDTTADLTAATEVESVTLGGGDDELTVNNTIAVDATLGGGAGEDELIIEGQSSTIAPTLTGFETLTFAEGASGTFSGESVEDVETIKLEDGLGTNNNLSLSGFSNNAITLDFSATKDGTYTAGNVLTYSGESAVTVATTNEDADATSAQAVDEDVTLDGATSVNLSIGAYTDYNGDVTADDAEAVTVDVAKNGNADDARIEAQDATNITVRSAADIDSLDLDIESAEEITIDSNEATALDLQNADSVETVDTLGLGGIELFNIGGEVQSVEIDASTVKTQLSDTNNNGVSVTIGDYTGGSGGSVDFVGSTIANNNFTIGTGRDDTVSVTTGGGNDNIQYNTVIGSGDETEIDLDLGGGFDTVQLANAVLDLTDADITLTDVDAIQAASDGNVAQAQTTTLTMNASVISEQEIQFADTEFNGSGDNFAAVTLEGTSGDDSIDLSDVSHTVDNAADDGRLDVVDGNFTVEGGAGADTIVGTADEDVIDGGDGIDTIEAGSGADSIIGGAGADIIDLSATGSAAGTDGATDTIEYGATNLTEMAAEGGDTIQGFSDGTDVIQFKSGLLSDAGTAAALATDAMTVAEVAAGGDLTVAASGGIIEITGIADDAVLDTKAGVSAAIGGTVGSEMDVVFALSDGTDTYLWYFEGSSTNGGAVDANELGLIGVLDGVDGLDNDGDSFNIIS